jgi:hypothetical protein
MAPGDRFKDFEILATGVLFFECVFRSLTCCLVQATRLLFLFVFLRIAIDSILFGVAVYKQILCEQQVFHRLTDSSVNKPVRSIPNDIFKTLPQPETIPAVERLLPLGGATTAFSICISDHRVAEHQRGAMSKFKIGQALIFRKGSVKLSGRYVVLAILPQPPGKARYRIRSQDDGRTEHVAEERELSIA